jgi:hypothetical protein
MPEHFTKNTISAPCYTCMEKLESAATQPQPPAETQLDLWGKQ